MRDQEVLIASGKGRSNITTIERNAEIIKKRLSYKEHMVDA